MLVTWPKTTRNLLHSPSDVTRVLWIVSYWVIITHNHIWSPRVQLIAFEFALTAWKDVAKVEEAVQVSAWVYKATKTRSHPHLANFLKVTQMSWLHRDAVKLCGCVSTPTQSFLYVRPWKDEKKNLFCKVALSHFSHWAVCAAPWQVLTQSGRLVWFLEHSCPLRAGTTL